jgi:hypothetical protein
MKTTLFSVLIMGLLLSLSSGHNEQNLFQIISSHPHDLDELKGHFKTIHQSGRLWIVEVSPKAPAHIFEHLRPITGREKSYLFQGGDNFKSRRMTNERREILSIVNGISADRIKQGVLDLTKYRTRAAGTDDNRQATEQTEKRLKDLGYETYQICYREDACSVIAEKRGLEFPHQVNLVLGHIDSVGMDFAGADDNASGTSVLLEMARVLKDHPNRRTLRFFVTNGEELGLLGARHYVSELKRLGKISEIKLAINMDMVGYNSNGIVELETDPQHEPLARSFAEIAASYTKLKTKITLGAWGSDHVPFLQNGVPSLLTIEDWSTKTPCYHRRCDTPDTLNYQYAAEIGKLNVAAIIKADRD